MKQCIKGNHHQAMPIQRNNLPCKPKEITSKEKLRRENQFLEIKLANQVKLVRWRLREGPVGSLLSGHKWRVEPVLKVETLACESLCFAFESLNEVCLCRLEEVIYIYILVILSVDIHSQEKIIYIKLINEYIFAILVHFEYDLMYNLFTSKKKKGK